MKNRAELITTFILGYLILLSICILLYFIFANLVDLKFFSDKFDQATIITNLLIWSATLYAPAVAYMVLDSWREQTNKQMLSNEAKELWKRFVDIDKNSSLINIKNHPIKKTADYLKLCETDYFKQIKNIQNEINFILVDFYYFKELCKNKDDISKLYFDLYETNRDYNIQTEAYKNSYTSEFYSIEKEFREKLEQANENIRNYLSNYIHV